MTTYLGAAVIGFLLGLVFCFWRQLKAAYDNREALGAASDVISGTQQAVGGVQTLWQKL